MEDFDETFSIVTRNPCQVDSKTSSLAEVPILTPAHLRNGGALAGTDCVSCR